MDEFLGETIVDSASGQRITFLETGARVRARVSIPARTKGPPPHRHTRLHETFAVEAGTLAVTLNGDTRPLAAGSAVTVKPGETHTFANTSDEPATFVCTVDPGWHFEAGIRAVTALGQPKNPFIVAAIFHLLDLHVPVVPTALQKPLIAALSPVGLRMLRARGLPTE